MALEQLYQTSQTNRSAFTGMAQRLSGVDETQLAEKNAAIFEEFKTQTLKREDLLLEATKEQIALFEELEVAINDLKDANIKQTELIAKTVEDIAIRLGSTTPGRARDNMQTLIMGGLGPVVGGGGGASDYTANPLTQLAASRSRFQPATAGPAPARSEEYVKELYADAGLMGSENPDNTSGLLGQLKDAMNESSGSMLEGLLGALGLGYLGKRLLSGNGDKDKKTKQKNKTKHEAKAAAKTNQSVAKTAAQQGVKTGGKFGLKSLSKKVFGLGLLAGGVFAVDRALSGDFVGAGMELASGATSLVPGIGTAAGFGIDAALLARDTGYLDTSELDKLAADIAPATTPDTINNSDLTQFQSQNQQLKMVEGGGQPITVINNNSTPAITNPAPQFIAPTANLRPTESALVRYQNRESFY